MYSGSRAHAGGGAAVVGAAGEEGSNRAEERVVVVRDVEEPSVKPTFGESGRHDRAPLPMQSMIFVGLHARLNG